MLMRIRELLAPPVFEDDAEKTRMAGVLNTLLASTILILLFTLSVVIPFIFVEKLYNSIFILISLASIVVAYWLMHRGRVRLAGVLFVSTFWGVVTAFLPFAGGMTSVAVVFYVASTVIAGLLLGRSAAWIHIIACAMAGLAMLLLDSSRYAPPRLFTITPAVGWVDMILSLLLTVSVINLVVRSRNEVVASLQESEERYRSLFENNYAAMLLINPDDGTIVNANPAACAYYGWVHSVLVNKKIAEINTLTSEETALEMQAAKREERNYFLFKHRRADGTVRDVEVYSGPIAVEGQTLLYSIIHDITDRRLAEEALRRSEALYRQAIEVIGAVPYYQTYHPNAYAFMGEGIRQLTGYGPEEMTPELWHSLVQSSVALDESAGFEQDEVSIRARDSQIGVWKSDDCIRTRDEQLRWVMDAAVEILNEQGTADASLGILQDVTWRRQTEEALRESNRRLEATLAELRETQERMLHQERLATVGQLAAGIAHDFNNILASIVLYAHMMLRSEELSAQARSRLEVIAQQTNHAADLVQQILDFGRRSVLERQSLALDSFLKEVIRLLRRTLPENIHIDLDFAPDDYRIHADITRIQQVVVNLALNARDAMPNGGNLLIALSRVSGEPFNCVDCGPVVGGDWVQIAMTDTGAGIPSDVLPHIFEPFFTTRAPLGHGLGLAQVHGIVKQHDGHIDVQTQAGEGTTFRLYWPATFLVQPQAVDKVQHEAEQGHGETILVVEDDAVIRTALVDVFDMLGYRVLEASNGQEALDVCEHCASDLSDTGQNIDLVLSDWVMPVMGGLELVRELEVRHQTVKVVLITGYPLTEEVKGVVPQNVVGWMLKPLRIEQLTGVVSQALSRKI